MKDELIIYNKPKSNISEDFFEYNGATCFNIDVPNIGPAKAIAYDIAALKKAIVDYYRQSKSTRCKEQYQGS